LGPREILFSLSKEETILLFEETAKLVLKEREFFASLLGAKLTKEDTDMEKNLKKAKDDGFPVEIEDG